MKKAIVASGNTCFFMEAVGPAVATEEFAAAVLDSLADFSQYGIETGTYSGYITISTAIPGSKLDNFVKAVHSGILPKVALEILRSLRGELNAEAEVVESGYKFIFEVVQYERDSEHDFELVEDPFPLPDEEQLGRCVSLKIRPLVCIRNNAHECEPEKMPPGYCKACGI